jgi:hypothetical protein
VRRAASYARLVAAGGAVPRPSGDCTEAGSGTEGQAGGRDSWRGEVRHSCATIIFARNRRTCVSECGAPNRTLSLWRGRDC